MLPLLVTPGDPRGVGPEVTVMAWDELEDARGSWVALGDAAAVEAAGALRGVPVRRLASLDEPIPTDAVGVVDVSSEEPVEVAAIRRAVDRIRGGRASALVTGPIHKGSLRARGFVHAGHTDFLGELLGVEEPVMAFVGGRVRVALVTVHLPLQRVAAAIQTERVLRVIRVADAALRRDLGIARPHLLVCGLNPHAGDQGALGDEEALHIGPAVARARAEGLEVEGPISAEAAFQRSVAGEGDMVIAMYHDQGLVPLKALDFGRTVNWTLGIPIIRTSVDHGTAFDRVGSSALSASSMVEAIRWARVLVASVRAPTPVDSPERRRG